MEQKKEVISMENVYVKRINVVPNQLSQITVNGILRFCMEREKEVWALYPIKGGQRGPRLAKDRHSADLVERIECGEFE